MGGGSMTITKSGALASFYTVNKAPIKHLRVYFSPKQAGSGTASPENVREISGWNQIELYNKKKSLFPFLREELTITGSNYNGNSGWFNNLSVEYIPKTTLVYSVYLDATNSEQSCYSQTWIMKKDGKYRYSTGNTISAGSAGWSVATMTITNNDDWLAFGLSCKKGVIASKPMVEIGSIRTDYEPCINSTQTIDWSNDIGTIYGGYVDLITGELVQTFAMEEPNNNQFYFTQNYCYQWGHSKCNTDDYASAAYTKAISSHWKTTQYSNADFVKLNSNGAFWIGKNLFTAAGIEFTDEAIQAYIAQQKANGTPLQAGGPLMTPITYQLSPAELQTFIGRNNIWSNADRIEIEYDLAESNDELYRRRNILLQGAPHLETATGNVANFKTDLIAPIKEARVYFEPKQLGSGDPSPSNVREIVGYTGLEIKHTGGNLIDPTIAGSTQGQAVQTNVTPNADGTVTIAGRDGTGWVNRAKIDLPAGTYRLYSNFGSGYFSRYEINDVAEEINWQGYKTLTLDEPSYLRFKPAMGTDYPATGWLQLLYGNNDYDPRPYIENNISIVFPNVGMNILDSTQVWNDALSDNRWIIEQGKITCTSVGDGNSTRIWFTQTFQPGTYTISTKYYGTGIAGPRFICNKEFSGGTWNNSYQGWWKNIDNNKLTFTLTEAANIGLVYLSVSGHDKEEGTIYNIQLENGSSASTYHIYGNIVYGGYIDLISGAIVATDYIYKVSNTSDIANYGGSSYNSTIATNRAILIPLQTPIGTPSASGNFYCNKIKCIKTGTWSTPNNYIWQACLNAYSQLHIVFDNETVGITSDMDWTPRTQAIRAWLGNNPLTFVLPLRYPEIIGYISPQKVLTFKSTNNVWSSANGPVSIKYWTH